MQETNNEPTALAHSIDDGCRLLNIGRTLMSQKIRDGEIKTFRMGRRRLIPDSEIKRVIREAVEAEEARREVA